jgi:hypothetical protein
MDLVYEIYLNENKVFECKERNEAHNYIRQNHNDLLPFLEYEPLGDGSLEAWTNGYMDIKIVRIKKGKINIEKLLQRHIKREEKERPKEINVEKITPLTPRRTRIYDKNKKTEKAGEGKKKKDKDGNTWISKKTKNGEYKWTRYYEETHENKRKCPKLPAKNFDEGTEKRGLDGKIWQVKVLSNGNKKWFRK